MKLIVFGAPGAGKGTQAKFIARKFKIAHIATGDILREAIRAGIPLGKEAKVYLDAGKLVPDKIIIGLALERLKDDDCMNGFILDGFPRTLFQAKEFHRFHDIDIVLEIAIDHEVLIRRVTGRRSCPNCGSVYHIESNPAEEEGVCDECGSNLHQRRDDTEEILNNRLLVYHEQTKPLKNYYEGLDLLVEVNGNGTIEEINESINNKIMAIEID